MNEFCTTISSCDGRGHLSVILKRPSILTLAMAGKIPNPLLAAATKLFDFAPKSESVSIKEIGQVLHIIAEAALISPKYEEIKDNLTDEQLMEIYHYAKEGADGLEYFRGFRGVHKGCDNSESKQSGGEHSAEN